MKAAAIERKIHSNLLVAMKTPRRKPRPVNSVTSQQHAEILAKMDAMNGSGLALAVWNALLTGMRRAQL